MKMKNHFALRISSPDAMPKEKHETEFSSIRDFIILAFLDFWFANFTFRLCGSPRRWLTASRTYSSFSCRKICSWTWASRDRKCFLQTVVIVRRKHLIINPETSHARTHRRCHPMWVMLCYLTSSYSNSPISATDAWCFLHNDLENTQKKAADDDYNYKHSPTDPLSRQIRWWMRDVVGAQ